MHVYFSKKFTSQLSGTRQEGVTCEKCKTAFYYELTRTGTGTGEAPYYLGQASAAARAKAAAEKDLADRLKNEAELVPCYKCHWINTDLIERYRGPVGRRAMKITAFALIFAMVVVTVAGLVASQAHRNDPFPEWAIGSLIGIVLVSPVALIAARRWARTRNDPNANYPRRPTVPPGTPPALRERVDRRTGRPVLEPAPGSYAPVEQGEFAVVRAGNFEYPPVCCVCLAPAETVYSKPFKVHEGDDVLAVPLCRSCASAIRRRWWKWAVLSVLILTPALGLVVFLVPLPHIDQFGRWMLFALLTVFGGAIAVVMVPERLTKPYRLKTLDSTCGVFALATSNPQFTAMLTEQAR